MWLGFTRSDAVEVWIYEVFCLILFAKWVVSDFNWWFFLMILEKIGFWLSVYVNQIYHCTGSEMSFLWSFFVWLCLRNELYVTLIDDFTGIDNWWFNWNWWFLEVSWENRILSVGLRELNWSLYWKWNEFSSKMTSIDDFIGTD